MTDVALAWKLETTGPVLLVMDHNQQLPTAEVVETGETFTCPGCGQEHPRELIRYPLDPLVFFAVLGVRHGHVGRDW